MTTLQRFLFFTLFLPACAPSTKARSTQSLLTAEAPAQVTVSQTGDFLVDPDTGLGWSTRVSVLVTYSEAQAYCQSLGEDWRLPTLGELESMYMGNQGARTLRPGWEQGMPQEGLLFSSEELPVIDDNKQPFVVKIEGGTTHQANDQEGYARCVDGPISLQRQPFVEPSPEHLGERWWEKKKACQRGAIPRGTVGIEISCMNEGAIHGRTTKWSEEGRSDAYYEHGSLNGKATSWRPDGGKYKEVNYRNGEFHGRTLQWHDNGKKLSESSYVDGVLEGLHRRWDRDGLLIEQTKYRKGQIVQRLQFEQGKLRNGRVDQRFANGVVQYFGNFKKGMAIGKHYGFHENGQPHFERNYDTKGLPHGNSVDWDVQGQVLKMESFRHGTLAKPQVAAQESSTGSVMQ
jgi:antitoxin component YwqK of YwqJK toxin-antitoxin module